MGEVRFLCDHFLRFVVVFMFSLLYKVFGFFDVMKIITNRPTPHK